MLAISDSLSQTERKLRNATNYEQWLEAATAHDERSGAESWRSETESSLYDHASIETRLQELQQLRANNDDVGLLFALNEGIHGNQGGMGREGLYEKSFLGTKHVIEEYVDAIVEALNHINALPPSAEISQQDKIDFFHRAHLCFGRSALMLSGAGSLGYFHQGVAKTLVDNDLLPNVISGSSAGSVFAAVLGTHTLDELKEMLNSDELTKQSASDEPAKAWGLVRPRVDSGHLKSMLDLIVPNMTFQEAYEKTGRMISVTIAPYEEHQTSRLMNAVTSPNVFIRTAVMASCAVPGVFPPVKLTAKNVYGETQPYLPGRRWVDGAITDDLPAKRLARLYGVNHYIVSQANPLALAMMSGDKYIPLPQASKNFLRGATREWLRTGEKFSRKYLRQVPNVGQAMSMFYSVMAQDYTGDVNIAPSFNFVDPQKLLAKLNQQEIEDLVLDGERATWPQLERIRICTKIGRTLDAIVDDHATHNVQSFYKQRAGKIGK